MAKFGFGARGDDVINPVLFRLLVRGGEDVYGVAVLDDVAEGDVFVVDDGACAVTADVGVDVEGEIEDCGAFG